MSNTRENIDRSEEKILRFVTEEANDGWWDWKIQENYEYMSPKFWQTFGVDPETKKHDPAEWQDLIHPDDLKVALDNFQKHCDTKGKHPYVQNVRYKHAKGHWVTVFCRGVVVEWDDSGNAIRMVGSHTDITELKSHEERLKKANEKLSILNEELTQFAYRTSHDLKAPLVTIKGLSQMMTEDLESGDLEEVRRNIKVVGKQASKLEQLVVDILDLARADLEEQEYENVDIENLINDVNDTYFDLFKTNNVNLKFDIKNGQEVWSQSARLKQIFGNLICNAVKYSDPAKNNRFVHFTSTVEPKRVIFQIVDNGVGISHEDQEKLFDMFSRFNSDLADGSGLGMSIVKKNVDALGGKINLESSEKGSNFEIIFPNLKGEK